MRGLAALLGALVYDAVAVAGSQLEKTPRFQHTMEIFEGQLCVFGGKSTTIGVDITDFLLDYRCVDITNPFDQSDPPWKLQNSASRFAMPPLAQQSSVYDRVNHVIVPFGGQSVDGFSKAMNLVVYCTLYQAWGASNVIDKDSRRYLHSAVLQEASGDMVIFGGANDQTTAGGNGTRWNVVNRVLLDNRRHAEHLKKLDRSEDNGFTGKVLTDEDALVPERIQGLVQHAAILLNDTQMVVLGGNTYNATSGDPMMVSLEKAYIYDIDTMQWRIQNCTGDFPPDRNVFAYSLHERHIYIHGGVILPGWADFLNDMYELDTVTWNWRKMPNTSGSQQHVPVPRYAHQMKTLGHYLIITHGYIQAVGQEAGKGTGDPDIYIYDLRKEEYVDRYSPKGLTKRDLDTEWIFEQTSTTGGVAALSYILTSLVALVAIYYFIGICRDLLITRARPRPRRPQNREGLRSLVESYTETLRPTSYFADMKFGRKSHDTDNLGTAFMPGARRSFNLSKGSQHGEGKAPGDTNTKTHTASEGTTTVIEGGPASVQMQQGMLAQENMRHTRILDEGGGNTPYVSRKLTVSANIPTYRARCSGQRHSVKFSGYAEDESKDNETGYLSPYLEDPSMSMPIELMPISSEGEAGNRSDDDEEESLKVVNTDVPKP